MKILENSSKIWKTMCIQFKNGSKSQKRLNLQEKGYTNSSGFELDYNLLNQKLFDTLKRFLYLNCNSN